jgi:polysaccharide biosynthesis transport protein
METPYPLSNSVADGSRKSGTQPDYVAPVEAPLEDESWNPGDLVKIVRRRAILIVGIVALVTTFAWFNASRQKVAYTGSFQLLVEPLEDQATLDDITDTTQRVSVQGKGLDYLTQIQVLISPKTFEPIVKQIQTQYPEEDYGSILGSLSVDRPKDTKLIIVSYTDSNPRKAYFILDQISKGYLRYSKQERQSNLRQGIGFVNGQIGKTQERVNTLQQQLQVFRQRNEFIDPSTQANQIAAQLNTIEQQRLDTQKQLVEAQTSFNKLQQQPGAIAALAADPAYQRLLDRLRELDSKIAVESARFRGSTPEMLSLQDQRRNLLPLLRSEAQRVLGDKFAQADIQLAVLEQRQQTIAASQNYWNQEVRRLPLTSRLYTDLQRELTVATESLNRLLQTREQLEVKAAQQDLPWQLINPPSPERLVPISNRGRTIILGGVAGVLLGVAAALLAERIDNRFRTAEDIRKQTRLPLLGVIPYHGQIRESAGIARLFGKGNSEPEEVSAFLEAFRSLYTNICLLSSDSPLQGIVITSALPGDGKSTVSLQLARAAAIMGKRVLLVDADFRQPKMSSRLQLSNEFGLSNLLTSNITLNQAIQPVDSNFFVITSGQSPPDPTKLLSSRRMQALSDRLTTIFDLVIYDAPPLRNSTESTLADSRLLAPYTDGIILVAGLGKTQRSDLMQAIEGLKVARIPVWGLVANHLN